MGPYCPRINPHYSKLPPNFHQAKTSHWLTMLGFPIQSTARFCAPPATAAPSVTAAICLPSCFRLQCLRILSTAPCCVRTVTEARPATAVTCRQPSSPSSLSTCSNPSCPAPACARFCRQPRRPVTADATKGGPSSSPHCPSLPCPLHSPSIPLSLDVCNFMGGS